VLGCEGVPRTIIIMQAAVIVLGDLGRSPRMQYHAVALAVNGVDVDLIGEEGFALPAALLHPRITVHRLARRRGAANVPGAAIALFARCLRIRKPDVIVVQTPPAIPTLAVAWLAARLRGARLIFDWHNVGWTLLALRSGPQHPLVIAARWIERACATLPDAHLCVSAAMAAHLRKTWHAAPVHVLRDRPGAAFAPAAAREAMRARLIGAAGLPDGAQPAILVSPTSWTRDEDLELILEAADRLDASWSDSGPADGAVIVISGEGAGRAAFDAQLTSRPRARVRVITTWVPAGEYPELLASADAGLSLHRSSSGLDLPMKICDLFGSGVPVCAFDYGPTIREMVDPDRNALLFRDAGELASCVDALFRSRPEPSALWLRLRAGAAEAAAGPRWIDGWNREARAAVMESRS
jgi:beta-1,4-mannosyltransferase